MQSSGTIHEVQAEDALALRVEAARRDESQALVEGIGATLGDDVAGVQLRRTLGSDEPNDLLDDRATDAAALVPLVHDELPEEPGTDDVRRLRSHVPAEHDEADRLALQVHGAVPRAALRR